MVLAIAVVVGVVLGITEHSTYLNNRALFLFALLCAWLALFLPPTVRAAKGGYGAVRPVCVLSLIHLLVVLFVFVSWYFSLAGTSASQSAPQSAAAIDRLLNIPPVIVAVWAATMGWYVHHQATAKNSRTANAFNVVMQTRTASEFRAAANIFQLVFPGSVQVEATDREFFPSDAVLKLKRHLRDVRAANGSADEKRIALEKVTRARAIVALKYLLNYYEFIAAGIRANDLDEEIIYQTLSETMVSLVNRSQNYVAYVHRKVDGLDQPLAFEHLIDLSARWSKRLAVERAAEPAQARTNGKPTG